MALDVGTRLGAYEITASIGAGGMGEVYRARDTSLHRDVALKVLPVLFASDPERLARFKREAQLLASLNHPNIAAIYGLAEGSALVMEFVEGLTLAERIAQGAVPLDEALPIARQIGDAIQNAHEHGIIHRDLKPANIKVRPDGTVKVLDFGLAKAFEGEPAGSPAMTMSPTITSPAATGLGVILGTAAYMSPEQARGKTVDKRTDIWAFGCVLFEMLTGRRAFEGEEISDVLASILTKEPDWSALPPDTPIAIRRLLRRCLQKDRTRRLDSAADAHLEIDEAVTDTVEPSGRSASGASSMRRFERLGWGAAVLAALAFGGAAYLRPAAETPQTRFQISVPEGWNVVQQTATAGAGIPLAVSPDGRRVAFVARDADGDYLLWVRSLDVLDARALPGTEGASSPFWSPDSRSIGFFAGRKLKRVEVSGGPPVTLADAPNERHGSWNQDGVIVFAPTSSSVLQQISASGGETRDVTVLRDGETGHARPFFMPDGRHFLYRAYAAGGREGPVYIASLDSPEATLLFTSDSSNVVFAQNHLLFLRDTTLMARPFDPRSFMFTGDPFQVAEQVQAAGQPLVGVFSASTNGVLVFQANSTGGASELVWFDRAGARASVLGEPDGYGDVELSPDGTRAIVSLLDPGQGTRDLWLVDIARGLKTRFTFDPADEAFPAWSPDGTQVVFASDRDGTDDLYVKSASGVGNDKPLIRADGVQRPFSWSRDGRHLVYESGLPVEVWALPLLEDAKPLPVVQTSFNTSRPKFSPDGRWVLYGSSESGRAEIYVTSFPNADGKWQVSIAGGQWARWRADGAEIYYLAADDMLMAAEVIGKGPAFQVGAVKPLFKVRPVRTQRFMYDVSRDGQRFLVNTVREETGGAAITVVLNWTAGLDK